MSADIAFAHCVDQVRKHDHDRYLCSLFLPKPARVPSLALYALNLEIARIPETVSEPLLGEMRLAWWREAVDEAFGGEPRAHPVTEAIAAAADRLDRPAIHRLIDARAADLLARPFATPDELVAYAVDTSSGLMAMIAGLSGPAVDVWSPARPEDHAVRAAGIAAAISGLLRAMPFHARTGRIYVPADLARDAGLHAGGVPDGKPGPELKDVVARLISLAREHLRIAADAASAMPRSTWTAILPCTLVNRDLDRLERAGGDPFALTQTPRPVGRLLRVWWAHRRRLVA